jgi:hypothetical protein
VYTQWRDVAWEDGAGLADVWGGSKPVLAVFEGLNAEAGSTMDPFDAAAVPPPGDGSPVEAVGDLLDLEPEVEAAVSARLRPRGDDAPTLAVVGFRPNMWGPGQIDTTVSLLRWVRDGGTALLLAPPHAGRPLGTDMFGYDTYGAVADLPLDLRVRPARGHFVGKHLVFSRDMAATLGLDANDRLFGPRFRSVRPARVLLHGGDEEVSAQLLGFDTYGLVIGAAIQTVRYGQGLLILSTLPLEADRMDDPVALAVLDGLLRHAAARARADAPPREAVTVPEELVDSIGRSVWRHRVYFGLAERLAWQDFNGRRPVRRDPDDLAGVIARKNAGLDLIMAGEFEAGAEQLAGIDAGPLEGERDSFLRAELAAARLYRERTTAPPLPDRLRLSLMHARALEAMRGGETGQAMDRLQRLRELVAALPPDDAPAADAADDQPDG